MCEVVCVSVFGYLLLRASLQTQARGMGCYYHTLLRRKVTTWEMETRLASHSWWLLAYVLFAIMPMIPILEVSLQSDCSIE